MQSLAATAVVVEGKSRATVCREGKSRRALVEPRKKLCEPALRSACYS
jgi:hypothetical protein